MSRRNLHAAVVGAIVLTGLATSASAYPGRGFQPHAAPPHLSLRGPIGLRGPSGGHGPVAHGAIPHAPFVRAPILPHGPGCCHGPVAHIPVDPPHHPYPVFPPHHPHWPHQPHPPIVIGHGHGYGTGYGYAPLPGPIVPVAVATGAAVSAIPVAAPVAAPACGVPVGTFVSVTFVPTVTATDITTFLRNYHVTMAAGPDVDGVYRIRLADEALPRERVIDVIESMRTQKAIIVAVNG